MKSTLYSALGSIVATAMVVGWASPASADGPESRRQVLEAAVAAQPYSPATVVAPKRGDELHAVGRDVTAPAGHGETLTLTLPGRVATPNEDEDLIVGMTNGMGYQTSIQDSGSGTFRALVKIDAATAPRAYTFKIGDNAYLVPLEDGGVSVRNNEGDLIGVLEPAWALDASGAKVPTRYEIRGNAVVQHVGFTSATAFPVVADPFWIPALFLVARITAHAGVQGSRSRGEPSDDSSSRPEWKANRGQQRDFDIYPGLR